jgi:hypothetical protein
MAAQFKYPVAGKRGGKPKKLEAERLSPYAQKLITGGRSKRGWTVGVPF